MSIADVRQALADALNLIEGVRAVGWLTDLIEPPGGGGVYATVRLDQVDYDVVFGRGADQWNYTVSCFVSATDSVRGQKRLDDLREPAGATSVKVALEDADTVAAAAVDYIRVRSVSEVRTVTVGAVEYLSVDFTTEVVY